MERRFSISCNRGRKFRNFRVASIEPFNQHRDKFPNFHAEIHTKNSIYIVRQTSDSKNAFTKFF